MHSHEKNEIMTFAATWVEISQKVKDKYHMISLITGIEYPAQMNISSEKKIMDLKKRLVAA